MSTSPGQGEHEFVERNLVLHHLHTAFEEGEGKAVSRGKDHSVNIFPGTIFKDGRCLCELLDVWLHQHPARNDAVGQVVIDGWVLVKDPESTRNHEGAAVGVSAPCPAPAMAP